MKFWLEKGVSGFRVDAPMVLLEDEQLRDSPPLPPNPTHFTIFASDELEQHVHHPDTFRFLNELYTFVQQYDRERGKSAQT